MTDLRQAAMLALEALLLPTMKTQQMLIQRDEAIIALRRALEQQAEPVAWMTQSGSPVRFHVATEAQGKMYGWKALYTTPPQRKPLMDEDIKEAAPSYAVDDFLDFNAGVRFAEAAHNIKEA